MNHEAIPRESFKREADRLRRAALIRNHWEEIALGLVCLGILAIAAIVGWLR